MTCDQINCKGSCDCGQEIMIESNVRRMSLQITEPDINKDHMEDTKAKMVGILNKYMKNLAGRSHYHLGYPANLELDYAALTQVQGMFMNNIGDPFIDGSHDMHSRHFEVAVLDWFANLWEIQKNEYWGYVTVGGTEGNLHGLLTGREILPDGILYTSRESHYSIYKAARMYKIDCVKIDTLFTGEMDYKDFKAKLLRNKDKPAIVNVNIGTTVKGAVDNVDNIIQILEECEFSPNRFYIHCDGALSGILMPFIKHAPKISFKKPIGSVTISGHKFVGCPMPCGVYITRQYIDHSRSPTIEYLSTQDTTIMGSRSGHTPIFLWYTLNIKGYKGFQNQVQRCLKNARYLKTRLVEEGISAMLNELSTTVVFERPLDINFVHRWQLACVRSMAHVIVMPNVTIEKIDEFLEELLRNRSEWYKDGGGLQPPCLAEDVGGENCLCLVHK